LILHGHQPPPTRPHCPRPRARLSVAQTLSYALLGIQSKGDTAEVTWRRTSPSCLGSPHRSPLSINCSSSFVFGDARTKRSLVRTTTWRRRSREALSRAADGRWSLRLFVIRLHASPALPTSRARCTNDGVGLVATRAGKRAGKQGGGN
jgi:hypothetical protein